MRTIYIYLSVTGWIWFVIAGTYLFVKLKAKRAVDDRRGFTVKMISESVSTPMEAMQPNEQ